MATEEAVHVPVLPDVAAEETAAIVADLVVAPIEEANLVVPDSVVVADEESKPKKVHAVPRKKKSGARTHPTYFEMIKEAIVALKERNGSSQFAIAKFIEDNQKNLPANFRKTLLLQSKKLVVSGKLVKVKSSYKLPSKAAANGALPAKKKKAAAAKPKTKKAAVAAKKDAPPAKPKVVTAPKSKVVAKPAAAKSTLAASKAKPVVKDKPAARVRRTLEVSKAAATKPAKVQRTSTRSTPGNKPDVVVAKPAVEKSPVKSKATKKKASAKKGKK